MAAGDFASLYQPWWDALPAFFAGIQPAAAASPASPAPAIGGDSADPIAFFKQALELSGTALPRLLEGSLPLLQQGGPSLLADGLRALATLNEGNLQRLGEAWSGADGAAWKALLSAPAAASSALAVNAERTFGAFADALGMRPMRELQGALQSLAAAESDRRSALAAYLGVAAQAWGQGSQRLLARLGEMAANGDEVTSLIAFVRLWAREADAALHEAMQSEAGLAATANAVRAATRRRAELQRLVALASTALNVPTRAEVDDAFREIQQLKREIRRLRKGQPRIDDGAGAVAGTAAAGRAAADTSPDNAVAETATGSAAPETAVAATAAAETAAAGTAEAETAEAETAAPLATKKRAAAKVAKAAKASRLAAGKSTARRAAGAPRKTAAKPRTTGALR